MLIGALAISSGCATGEDPGTAPTAAPATATVQPSPPGESPGATVPSDVRQLERDIHEQVNQQRRDNGLEPLEYREDVAHVARDYSELMLEQDFFSHTGPEGDTVADRVREAGIGFTAVGENLSQLVNAPNPVEMAVQGWMESEGHRENILREHFTHTGVGVAMDDGTLYATQIFLTP